MLHLRPVRSKARPHPHANLQTLSEQPPPLPPSPCCLRAAGVEAGAAAGSSCLPGAGSGTVTLNGVATYDSIGNASGPLLYTAIASKPVRGATVEIVNAASSVLATATTDANGAYSVSVPSSTDLLVRVRAQMTQSGSGANWDVTVRDNTQSDAIYSMESPLFNSGVAALSRDVHAPSGWGGSGYSATRVAAPFAVLDTVYAAQAKVLSVAASTAFPPLRVFWSINNLPASGDRAQGQIGTTSFVSGGSGSRAIYVLGKENVDTDEYDSSVVAHEWGHYYQSAFSRDDSPGGNHSISQFVDRRLAFSEGWGNAWSGIALERSNYTDSLGSGQAQGTNLDLTVGPASGAGWFRESSVQSILWQLNKQAGFKPIHDTLTGAFKSAIAVTSIHPFAATYRAVSPSNAGLLDSLLTGQAISAAANDPFGTERDQQRRPGARTADVRQRDRWRGQHDGLRIEAIRQRQQARQLHLPALLGAQCTRLYVQRDRPGRQRSGFRDLQRRRAGAQRWPGHERNRDDLVDLRATMCSSSTISKICRTTPALPCPSAEGACQ